MLHVWINFRKLLDMSIENTVSCSFGAAVETLQSKQQSFEKKLGVSSTRIDCFEVNLASPSKLRTGVDSIYFLASRLPTQIKRLVEH